jgi:hypothetical protein
MLVHRITSRGLASALAVATSVLVPLAGVSAQDLHPGRETAIDWAREGSIVDWHAQEDDRLFIMDRAGRWYLATLSGMCPQLNSASTIGFVPGLSGRFDRFSSVLSQGVSCRVESLVRAPRPAAKGMKGQP